MREIMAAEFSAISQRYIRALQHALPGVPPMELFWRMFYTVGALLFTAAHRETMALLSHGAIQSPDTESIIRRLVDYASAAMCAPRREPAMS